MLSAEELLGILEDNRRLTIRVIEAFPEEKLFHYTAAETMRPFSQMVIEILGIEKAYVRGIAINEWEWSQEEFEAETKEELLAVCEKVRAETRELWTHIDDQRLETVEKDPFFDMPATSHFSRFLYSLENEIHHRGQGYVYLRALGIEPPLFYDRK